MQRPPHSRRDAASRPGPRPPHHRALARAAGLTIAVAPLACAFVGCATENLAGASDDATSLLSVLSGPTPADAAAWATDEFDPDKRQRGITLLANAPWGGESVYVDLYEVAAQDEDPGVRAAAARALGRHGSARHVPLIVPNLEADSRILRWEAAKSLQRLHNPDAVRPLIARLDPGVEPAAEVRAAAATALGQYGETDVVLALIDALNDRDLAVNDAAHQSLVTLTGQDHGLDTNEWIRWSNQAARAGTVFAERGEFIFPVFERDRFWYEVVVPWMEPPNEIAAAPAGMPGTIVRADTNPGADPATGPGGRVIRAEDSERPGQSGQNGR
ncbi:MAG: HEAT repeat domain-containing protein [Phycisphaerales bacterium]